jgi:16S rRNA (cytosine967-C5)-methyltransferase
MLALDIDAQRLRRVDDTLARLRPARSRDLARRRCRDARVVVGRRALRRVLLDAPCSATGVVRRQPDVLLHRRESDLDALCARRRNCSTRAGRCSSPGGVLLYATCSILRAENAAQVEAFLARTPDARVDALPDTFGREDGPGASACPATADMDGFFYARLRKG